MTNSEAETIQFGKNLSRIFEPGDVVGLFGNLGSGKTCLIRGICSGLDCGDDVSSPTFTIINHYQGIFPVYHFDLYRIDSEQEIYELGYEEYLKGSGLCLIEWAERMVSFLPENHFEIYLKGVFEPGKENVREITIKCRQQKIKMQKLKNLLWF